jgi:N-hydroxyarylamine O-acetyltransferase
MDVEAYLKRIRYPGIAIPGIAIPGLNVPDAGTPDTGRPSAEFLRSLHRAHLFTVPFENLDIALGREIICEEACFLHKIVNERRGGFCYELNGAFATLLRGLGFRVTLLSACPAREDGSIAPEFDHLALLVDLHEPWLADVGFGDCFTEPLRLETTIEQAQNGRVYRLMSSGKSFENQSDESFSLEVLSDSDWKKEYVFTLQPRELRDFAVRCKYHQTSPDSHFARQRICSMATPEGRITLSGSKLIETRGSERQETLVSGEEEWHTKLRELFGVILPSDPMPSRNEIR